MCIRPKENRKWTVGELIEALMKLDKDRPVAVEGGFEECIYFQIRTGLLNAVVLRNDNDHITEEEGTIGCLVHYD